jgi:hypothetical protein
MRTAALLLAPLWLLALGAREADACSVCLAGDPSFSAQGSSSQPAGSFSVYTELRGWQKSSGLATHHHGAAEEHDEPATGLRHPLAAHGGHEHEPPDDEAERDHEEEPDAGGEERNEGRRLDLYAAWTPLDRLTLTLNVPWSQNGIEEVEGGTSTYASLSGLGDVSLAASGVVWRNRAALPSTWVELRGWGKAPTGRDERRENGVEDPHLQTGTGSWDYGFGTALVHKLEWAGLYASAFYRVNTEGALDYEYGDVVLVTAAIEVPLGHASGVRALDRLTPGIALDYRWAQQDDTAQGNYADSGGSILYVSPSVRVALPAFGETQRAWLRAGVQVPASNAWLNGEQHEDPVWSVGIGYGF